MAKSFIEKDYNKTISTIESEIPTKLSQLQNDSGFTTNTGTITGIKMNGASKGTSGVVDLGTILTAWRDADYVTAQGTSSSWRYRKWNSGVKECWRSYSFSITAWSTWGSLYESNQFPALTFPFTFTNIPCVIATAPANSAAASMGVEFESRSSTSATPKGRILRATTTSAGTGYIDFYVIGV